MSVSALAPPVVEYGVTSSSCVSANADGTIPSAPARSARKISFLTWRDPFCWTTSSRDVALTSVGRRARRDLVPRTGDLSGAPATTGAPLESSLVPLLDPGERVLAARERARDAGRVALLEPCVHVGRLVGRDRARQACDGDRGRRERRDRAACLALLGPRLRRSAAVRGAELDRRAAGGGAAELAVREPCSRVESCGQVRDQLRPRIVCTTLGETGDRAVVVDRVEFGFRIAYVRDVDLKPTLHDSDTVGRVDGTAGTKRDRAREVRIARPQPGVLAVRDDDRLAVGRRARPRRHARRGRGERPR